jgi:hypothetical protein
LRDFQPCAAWPKSRLVVRSRLIDAPASQENL